MSWENCSHKVGGREFSTRECVQVEYYEKLKSSFGSSYVMYDAKDKKISSTAQSHFLHI
jgi:hypothetical protein